MAPQFQQTAHPDYGLDAPTVVRYFLMGGAAGVAAGLAILFWGRNVPSGALVALGGLVLLVGGLFAALGGLMLRSSRVGKLRLRDRLLDGLHLTGNETVLDVGCGRGLLLIGAAKRLPAGKALGIDLWSQTDQAHNSRTATLANAAAEGVDGKVEVLDGDMRALPLADASVDAVVASLAIHNISAREGRSLAIGEMVRVLKPGGQVALLDIRKTSEYAQDLRALGLQAVQVSRRSFQMYLGVRIVTARKAREPS
jgi:arsenite methyltransferase